jgi:uncharacterized protein (DUF2126 family)
VRKVDPLDARLAAAGLAITIGAEPTFTRRESVEPWWLWQADPDVAGADDKLIRAAAIAATLARLIPGATVQRVIGRQYPDEDRPRFCFGVSAPRAALGGHHAVALLDTAADARELPEVAGLVAAAPAPMPNLAPDETWLTVTSDPGVVEINTAPCADLSDFADHLADVWTAAGRAGLSSARWRFNGDETDSGGGGQLTLGGPTPETSPFFLHPALLPRLVRYAGNHPCLSYWFLGECAGSASQSPRADEGVRERWEELRLACTWLEHEAARRRATPEVLWSTLAPLLVDASANSHRAELNVEKLWNPHLPGRGQLGLVELRAFRMAREPEDMVAAAALVRAVAARCALAPYDAPMIDWGAELHDRWALPWFLGEDLAEVLEDLDAHGLSVDHHRARLLRFRPPPLARAPLGRALVSLSRAVEFWPLVGDVASQERATARLVDASSERLELVIACEGDDPGIAVTAGGHAVAPRVIEAGGWRHHVLGLRRRQYLPAPGLLPTLPADEPLAITVRAGDLQLALAWHAWRPGSGMYDGLPGDTLDAEARRAERLIVRPLDSSLRSSLGAFGAGPDQVDRSGSADRPERAERVEGPYTVDLRTLRREEP